jgi:hypothetical protein
MSTFVSCRRRATHIASTTPLRVMWSSSYTSGTAHVATLI